MVEEYLKKLFFLFLNYKLFKIKFVSLFKISFKLYFSKTSCSLHYVLFIIKFHNYFKSVPSFGLENEFVMSE